MKLASSPGPSSAKLAGYVLSQATPLLRLWDVACETFRDFTHARTDAQTKVCYSLVVIIYPICLVHSAARAPSINNAVAREPVNELASNGAWIGSKVG